MRRRPPRRNLHRLGFAKILFLALFLVIAVARVQLTVLRATS